MTAEFYGAHIDAVRCINKLLSLPAIGREQDWEIELANPALIDDIYSIIMCKNIEESCRDALISLLISSVEEAKRLNKEYKYMISKIISFFDLNKKEKEKMFFYFITCKGWSDKEVAKKIFNVNIEECP